MAVWMGALISVSLVIVVAFVATYSNYRHDLNAATSRIAGIQTQTYHSQYGDIEYRLAGSGSTILVSHGVTGGVDQGMLVTDEFVSSEGRYQFLYVSRFGYLRSSFPENASARLQAAAYNDLLDHLGIEKVFVFGNSAGGTSSMWFAIDHPERTLGLILHSSAIPGPTLPVPLRSLFKYNLVYWAAVKLAPGALIGILLPNNLRSALSREDRAWVIKSVFLNVLPSSERTEGIMFDSRISNPSVNEVPLEEINVPTLILQSVDDPREKQGGVQLSERISGSEYVPLLGGHFLLGEQARVKTAIDGFIGKRQRGYSPGCRG
jgi:pimeloyl-ACP methyl ester carboxylesterase